MNGNLPHQLSGMITYLTSSGESVPGQYWVCLNSLTSARPRLLPVYSYVIPSSILVSNTLRGEKVAEKRRRGDLYSTEGKNGLMMLMKEVKVFEV